VVDFQATLADRLRVTRRRRGWSREALARAAGVSYAAVVQVESGRRSDVRLTTISALAGALGVSLDYLIARSGAPASLLEHQVLTYRSDEELLAASLGFVEEGIANDEPVLVVTTPHNIRLLRRALKRDDEANATFRSAARWYRSPLAALTAYQRFAMAALDAGHHWVRVVGQPVWTGRSPQQVEAWIRYEALINIAFSPIAATIICLYDARETAPEVLARAQATHCQLRTAEAVVANEDVRAAEDVLLGLPR
jgi:transcriptional regulator with XRE-family HTH domain